MKKYLILVSLFFSSLLIGQTRETAINAVDYLKVEVYKSIITSKEFKSNKNCHIVGIKPIALTMDYSIGNTIGDLFYNIKEIQDSISIKELRNELPKKNWVFKEPDNFLLAGYDISYILELKESDHLYIQKNIDFESNLCRNSLTIIKIYEPLDKWMNFYKKYYSQEYKNFEVVIPVRYVSLTKGSMIPEKEKYYLFKITISYNNQTELKLVKEIIEEIKEEREIISN